MKELDKSSNGCYYLFQLNFILFSTVLRKKVCKGDDTQPYITLPIMIRIGAKIVQQHLIQWEGSENPQVTWEDQYMQFSCNCTWFTFYWNRSSVSKSQQIFSVGSNIYFSKKDSYKR